MVEMEVSLEPAVGFLDLAHRPRFSREMGGAGLEPATYGV